MSPGDLRKGDDGIDDRSKSTLHRSFHKFLQVIRPLLRWSRCHLDSSTVPREHRSQHVAQPTGNQGNPTPVPRQPHGMRKIQCTNRFKNQVKLGFERCDIRGLIVNHLVRPEVADPPRIDPAAHRADKRPAILGKLNHRRSNTPRGADDQNPLTFGQTRGAEEMKCRGSSKRQRSRSDIIDRVRKFDQTPRRMDAFEFRMAAHFRPIEEHHTIPHLKIRDRMANPDHLTGCFRSEHGLTWS